MPWNISSARRSKPGSRIPSRAGSIVPHRVPSTGGFPTSAGFRASAGLGSLDRRASRRLMSASPLFGRGIEAGQRPSELSLDLPADNDAEMLGELRADDPALEEFELYGPAAGVNTQTAQQSQWLSGILERESRNFLDFVSVRLEEKAEAQEHQGAVESITLEELLPPDQNTRVVASQAFLHLLTLATRGLLEIQQADIFAAPISITIVQSL